MIVGISSIVAARLALTALSLGRAEIFEDSGI
jgi:hypothetical protein